MKSSRASSPGRLGRHVLRGLAGVAGALLLAVLAAQVARAEVVQLRLEGGTYVVPVLLNFKVVRTFTIDSGSADVSVPEDVFTILIRSGTIAQGDLLDTRRYRLADGSEQTSRRFLIRSMRVGNTELHDVIASVVPEGGELLLGQSFLARLSSWSIDNDRHVLVLNGSPRPAAPPVAESAALAPSDLEASPPVALPTGDTAFVKALAYLVTGSDDPGAIKVVNRAECIVETRPRTVAGAAVAHSDRAVQLHFNNVDRGRSDIRATAATPPGVQITLRGVAVAENPAQPGSKAEAEHTILLPGGEYQHAQSAWTYIYSHGCR